MIIATVMGQVWSTLKDPNLTGFKLLMVQDLNHRGTNKVIVAIDQVNAGIGDRVLVVNEGGSARQCMRAPDAPVNAAAIAFVDSVDGYPDE